MKRWKRKQITAVCLAATMVMSLIPAGGYEKAAKAATKNATQEVEVVQDNKQVDASSYGLMNDVQGSSILHCWNWSYKTIEENMELIAECGYTAVQTSPATQPKDYMYQGNMGDAVGYPKAFGKGNWWKVYQPVTFSVCDNGQTWFGTKAELESMCKTAEKYGIKVIVDIVANHMGNIKGWENSLSDVSPQVGEYWNPDMLTDESFWHINKGLYVHSSDGRDSFTQGCMGMPDLNTANKTVQKYVYEYLDELIDCGVDGFRFDAAKHIETPDDDPAYASDFWPTVLGEARSHYTSVTGGNLYVYGEILNTVGDNFSIDSYTKYMSVTDNGAGDQLLNSVRNNQARASIDLRYPANKAVVWAESHDTYMNESSMYGSDRAIVRAWAVAANKKDAASLFFVRPYYSKDTLQGDKDGCDINADTLSNDLAPAVMGECSTYVWASKEVAAINHFNNRYSSIESNNGVDGNVVYIQRGDGILLVSYDGAGSVSVGAHGLKDGSYKDEVSGNTFTVAGGTISGQIGSEYGVAALYSNPMSNPGEDHAVMIKANVADGSKIYMDTLPITLTTEDSTASTYEASTGEKGSFTESADIEIGAGASIGDKVTLKVTAKNSRGTFERTFTFTKADLDLDECVFFKTNRGWTKANAYAYFEQNKVTTETDPNGWPGFAMFEYAKDTDGKTIYAAQIADIEKYNSVNFNNGVAEMTTSMGNYGQLFDASNKTWTDYVEPGSGSAKISASAPSSTIAGEKEVTFTVSNADSATYALNNGAATAFSGTTATVTVGKDLEEGKSDVVTIVATKDGKEKKAVFTYTMGENKPVLSVTPGSGETFADTLDVTVSAENVTEATYIVGDGQAQSFEGTKKITIGKDNENGDMISVTVYGKSSNGKEATVTETYVKAGKSQNSNAIYFKNAGNWGSVTAHVWAKASDKSLSKWPGTAMTLLDEENQIYVLELDPEAGYDMVIFSNNGQSQTADTPIGGLGQVYENGKWSDYAVGTKPTISCDQSSKEITEPISVTLTVKDAESAAYKLGNGKETTFKDSVTLTVGEDLKAGEIDNLVVKAVNGEQIAVAAYRFTMAGSNNDSGNGNGNGNGNGSSNNGNNDSIVPGGNTTPGPTQSTVTKAPGQTEENPTATNAPGGTSTTRAPGGNTVTTTGTPIPGGNVPTATPGMGQLSETPAPTQNTGNVTGATNAPGVTPSATPAGTTNKKVIDESMVLMEQGADYNGTVQKPMVIVNGLTEDKDYTVTYNGEFKNTGIYTVIITGIGDYTGTVEGKFSIELVKNKVYTGGNMKYRVTNEDFEKGTVTVVSATKKTATVLSIGSTVTIGGQKLKITAIGASAFRNMKNLKAVSVGSNVKVIGSRAFYGDAALKKIAIKSKVLSKVGSNAIGGISNKAIISGVGNKVTLYKKLFNRAAGFRTSMKIKR